MKRHTKAWVGALAGMAVLGGGLGCAHDSASATRDSVKSTTSNTMDSAKDTASQVSSDVSDTARDAKDTVQSKASDAQQNMNGMGGSGDKDGISPGANPITTPTPTTPPTTTTP